MLFNPGLSSKMIGLKRFKGLNRLNSRSRYGLIGDCAARRAPSVRLSCAGKATLFFRHEPY